MIQESILIDEFADIRILRFPIKNFDTLSLQKKQFIYHLAQATIAGRDILYDQHFKYNLVIRTVLEAICKQLSHPANSLTNYLNTVWFSNGIHHHYSTRKLVPEFTQKQFSDWFNQCKWDAIFPDDKLQIAGTKLTEIIFNSNKFAVRSDLTNLDELLQNSCVNFYNSVSQTEAETYYQQRKNSDSTSKISHGLNSTLIKTDNQLIEQTWSAKGKYQQSIKQIINHLTKALSYASSPKQAEIIKKLVAFYETGDLKTFDEYSILWVDETENDIDFINGFIEVYADPLGIKGTWEAMVNLIDEEETQQVKIISDNADWFEKHSPIDNLFKKDKITGVSMRIIQTLMLGGDCYPASPLGINLPNADWIREQHGSKSVSISNIHEAYHQASLSSGISEEFCDSNDEIERNKKYGYQSNNLHTHLHECLGHGSGKLNVGITSDKLKSYSSVIEEARADLFALYFMADDKMLELGLLPTIEAAYTHYDSYFRNGYLTQLTRIKLGDKLEQAHMRNRQLIVHWCIKRGKAEQIVEIHSKNEKTTICINDYAKLRYLFGELLCEVQRIKSEGDLKAAQQLIENYGTNIDYKLHQEVLNRFEKLDQKPFTGFINPIYEEVKKGNEITDVIIRTTDSFYEQNMHYSKTTNLEVEEAIKKFNLEL